LFLPTSFISRLKGDSGGPLVVAQDGVLVLTGVVSGGIGIKHTFAKRK